MSQMKTLDIEKPSVIDQLDDLMQLMADYGFEDLANVLDLVLRDFDRRTR
jgi:hypothetical protein